MRLKSPVRFTRHRLKLMVSKQFCFSISVACLFLAKLVHLYAHGNSIQPFEFLLWGATLFWQDLAILIIVRALLTAERPWGVSGLIGVASAVMFSTVTLLVASVNISFFAVAGAEIHWRQMSTFAKDTAAIRVLLYGAAGCSLVAVGILSISLLLTPSLYGLFGRLLDELISPLNAILQWRHSNAARSQQNHDRTTQKVPDGDDYATKKMPTQLRHGSRKIVIISIAFALLVLLRTTQPHESTYSYLSWSLLILPFLEINSKTGLDSIPIYKANAYLNDCGLLKPPPKFDWLPKDKIAGFEDWYGSPDGKEALHYSAEDDCLHPSNLDNDLLEPIRSSMRSKDVKIKHVVLVKMESTRYDMLPLVRDSVTWNRIAESWPDNQIPPEVEQKLGNLTPNANRLFGGGFGVGNKDSDKATRAGLVASNAFTTSSYTLKSLTGTLCGVSPLLADFNQEYRNRIYQPCIPQILAALNSQSVSATQTDVFTSWPWKSTWMQSVTDSYDNQNALADVIGFNQTISRDTLIDPDSPHYPPKSENINYFGLPETELKPYCRDLINDAEKNHERIFLTHMTSSTHHPWSLPRGFPVEQYVGSGAYGFNRKFNRYLNTMKFFDNWLGDILSVLEETGVANETLLILTGDHGISLPDDRGGSTYENPHEGNFHIPLLFHHPALPPVQIDSPVTTAQILPTLLDLLISSSSLNAASSKAATDVLSLYEGQSLLRPQIDSDPTWHFSVINPGGSWLAIRSTQSSYRIAVPLVSEVEWRFTDLQSDPHERNPILKFDFWDLTDEADSRYGHEALAWAVQAANVAKYWVAKNRELWRFDPNA